MKLKNTVAFLAIFTACILHASAQEQPVPLNATNYNKPKFYKNIPRKLPLRTTELESLLNQPVGAKVRATIAPDFTIAGTVVSKSGPADPSVKSVVIKVSSHQGSTFTFTRITEANGRFSFSGRMLNRAAGDAMEIVREGNGYALHKKETHEIISE